MAKNYCDIYCSKGHNKSALGADGRGRCIQCHKERAREWARTHPEEHAENGRLYRAAHPDRVSARHKRYKAQHPEVNRRAQRRYRNTLNGSIVRGRWRRENELAELEAEVAASR